MQNKIMMAYKEAMISKNEDRKRVINTLRAEIKNKEIELRPSGKEITDGDIMSLIQKIIKQNIDAITMFSDGGREDLVEKNKREIDILEEFLPTQMTEEEIVNIIQEIMIESGASSLKDMGKIMSVLKEKFMGKMDFSIASKKIKELLS